MKRNEDAVYIKKRLNKKTYYEKLMVLFTIKIIQPLLPEHDMTSALEVIKKIYPKNYDEDIKSREIITQRIKCTRIKKILNEPYNLTYMRKVLSEYDERLVYFIDKIQNILQEKKIYSFDNSILMLLYYFNLHKNKKKSTKRKYTASPKASQKEKHIKKSARTKQCPHVLSPASKDESVGRVSTWFTSLWSTR